MWIPLLDQAALLWSIRVMGTSSASGSESLALPSESATKSPGPGRATLIVTVMHHDMMMMMLLLLMMMIMPRL